MCRALAYLGPPLRLSDVLYTTDNALVTQTYDPQQLHMLNLAGFGLAAWVPDEDDTAGPLLYRNTLVPFYDANLASLSKVVRARCLLAHVRGLAYRTDAGFGPDNLHPFLFPQRRLALAHNGDLAGFDRMRAALSRQVAPELAVRVRGTTDSEWIHAVLSTVLDGGDPPDADALLDGIEATIRVLREVRAAHGIDTSSSMNLFLSDGERVAVVRYTFDFGRYPLDPAKVHEANSRYLSLWYTLGGGFTPGSEGAWTMAPADAAGPSAVLAASEPLTRDTSSWVEVPPYTAMVFEPHGDGLRVHTRELDA